MQPPVDGDPGAHASSRVELGDYVRILRRYTTLLLAGPVVIAVLAFGLASVQAPTYQAAATIIGRTVENAAIPPPAVITLRALVQSTPVVQAGVAGTSAASIDPATFVGRNLIIEHLRDTNMMTVTVRLGDAPATAVVANRLAELTIAAYEESQPPIPAPPAPPDPAELAKTARANRLAYTRARDALAAFRSTADLAAILLRRDSIARQPYAIEDLQSELREERTLDSEFEARQQAAARTAKELAAAAGRLDVLNRRLAALSSQQSTRDTLERQLISERAALAASERELASLPASPESADMRRALTLRATESRARIAGLSADLANIPDAGDALDALTEQTAAARAEHAAATRAHDQALAAMADATTRRNKITLLEVRLKTLQERAALAKADAARLPRLEDEQARLTRELKRTSDLVAADEAKLAGGPPAAAAGTTNNRLQLAIGQRAEPPTAPIAPTPVRSAALGAALGLLASIVAAFIADYLRPSAGVMPA